MSIENLKVSFDADTRGFNKGLKSVQSGITCLKSGITGLVKTGLGLAGLSAGVYGLVQSMKAYAGLRNSVQRTNELFQASNKYISYFAENTARGFGLAETTAYQYAMVYGNLFKAITSSTEENAKVTIAMMKASGVIASKTGRTMEDVSERIRSGILGNTEAIEDLGISVPVAMIKTTKAFQDVAKGAKWENLTYQQQQQIRVLAILEQATNQYGNSVSQIAGWSLPRLGQAFKDLIAYSGMFVTAGLQPVINALGSLVTWATAGLKALARLFGMKVEGTLASNTGSAASAQNNLAGGANEAAKALGKQAKAAKKAKAATQGLSGFDELNILPSTPASSDTGSGGTGGAGGTGVGGGSVFDGVEMPEYEGPEIDTSKLEASFNKLKGLFDFTNLIKSWDNLKKALQPISAKIGDGLKWLFDNVLIPLAAWTINSALPAFLNVLAGAFKILNPILDAAGQAFQDLWTYFLQPIAAWTGGEIVFILNGLANALSKVGDWMSENKGLIQTIALFVGSFAVAWIALNGALSMWLSVSKVVTIATKGFKLLKGVMLVLTSPIGLVALAVAALITVGILLYKNWDTISTFLANTGKKIKKDLTETWEGLKNFLTTNWNLIKTTVTTIFTAIANTISSILTGIKNTFTLIVSAIKVIIDGLSKAFGNVLTAMKSAASNGVNSIKNTMSNVFNTIKSTATNTWNNIKNAITNPINKARDAVKSAIDKIKGFFNFKWSLPKLKMPEIKISGGFSLLPPRVPEFKLKWNAKGALFTKPTIAGMSGNTLQGFGEAGPEAAIPLTDRVLGMIGNSIASTMDIESNGINNMLSKMDTLLSKMQPAGSGDTYVQIGNDQLDAYIYKSNDRRNIRGNGR